MNLDLILGVTGRLRNRLRSFVKCLNSRAFSKVQGRKSETTNPKHFAITDEIVPCQMMLGNSSSSREREAKVAIKTMRPDSVCV